MIMIRLKASVNPDYFNFVNVENLSENEKVVFILAASMDSRLNKQLFELIFENIVKRILSLEVYIGKR